MTNREVFDIEELEKTFRIIDGKLERINRQGNPYNPKWKVVGNNANHGQGYCRIGFNGRLYLYHVILWTLYYRENIPKGLEIDHVNGDRLDNRIENLRLATQRENCQNLQCHRDGKLVGALYCKRKNKYRALIRVRGKQIQLGLFKTAKESHEAYEIACKHIEEYVDNESFRAIIKNKLYN